MLAIRNKPTNAHKVTCDKHPALERGVLIGYGLILFRAH